MKCCCKPHNPSATSPRINNSSSAKPCNVCVSCMGFMLLSVCPFPPIVMSSESSVSELGPLCLAGFSSLGCCCVHSC